MNTCQCPHNGDGCNGPVAYRVVRDGITLEVCTRCDLGSDSDKVLLLDESTPLQPYSDYDPLGVLCIAFQLAEKSARNESMD